VDYNTPNYDYLTVKELNGAPDASGVHFDFIGFDACLMSMAEITYDLADNAKYIVGSQDLEPGNGWAYDDWLNGVFADKVATADEMVKGIVTTYAAEYPSTKGITLSAVDTAKEASLVSALDAFTRTVVDSTTLKAKVSSADIQMLTSDAQAALEFGGGKYEYIDVRQFFNLVAKQALSDSSTANDSMGWAAQGVVTALTDAVTSVEGNVSGAFGLSIYLPAGNESIATDYTAANYSFLGTGVPLWDDFLRLV